MTRVIETAIHGCTAFRVVRSFPGINNAITLGVTTDDGARFELTMYGLSELLTDGLIAALSDDDSMLDPKDVALEILDAEERRDAARGDSVTV